MDILSDVEETRFARTILSTTNRLLPLVSGELNFNDLINDSSANLNDVPSTSKAGGALTPDIRGKVLAIFHHKLSQILDLLCDESNVKYARSILSTVNRLFPIVNNINNHEDASNSVIVKKTRSRQTVSNSTTTKKPKEESTKITAPQDSSELDGDDDNTLSDEIEIKYLEIWNINARNFEFSPELVPDYNPFKIYNKKEVKKIRNDHIKLQNKYIEAHHHMYKDDDEFKKFLIDNNIIKKYSHKQLIELYYNAVVNNFYE